MPDHDDRLIFDIGLHHGLDSRFFLDKGFRVMGLEASPHMVERARGLLADGLADGRMAIETAALAARGGEDIAFYVSSAHDDWSSVFVGNAGRDGNPVEEIRARTITLQELFDRHGVPRYLKCDIEGSDGILVDQLLADARRPAFVSVEAERLELLAKLLAAGYDRFQLINQALNHTRTPPQPAREGRYAPVTFNGHMSGLFGLELKSEAWLDFATCAERFQAIIRLTAGDPELVVGWFDFHATTAAALATAPQ
jgi:FkbM family methyltransferase